VNINTPDGFFFNKTNSNLNDHRQFIIIIIIIIIIINKGVLSSSCSHSMNLLIIIKKKRWFVVFLPVIIPSGSDFGHPVFPIRVISLSPSRILESAASYRVNPNQKHQHHNVKN